MALTADGALVAWTTGTADSSVLRLMRVGTPR
jgi:hypothetical protein